MSIHFYDKQKSKKSKNVSKIANLKNNLESYMVIVVIKHINLHNRHITIISNQILIPFFFYAETEFKFL